MFEIGQLLKKYQSNKTFVRIDPDGVEVYAEIEILLFQDSKYKTCYTEYRGRSNKLSSSIQTRGQSYKKNHEIELENYAKIIGTLDDQYIVMRLFSSYEKGSVFLLVEAETR